MHYFMLLVPCAYVSTEMAGEKDLDLSSVLRRGPSVAATVTATDRLRR